MKFRCPKKDIYQAIQLVGRAVASKPNTPILSGVYMELNDNALELKATDFELGIMKKIAVDGEENGSVVVSGKYFQDIVRNLPDGEVEIEYNRAETLVNIKAGVVKFKLLSMAAEDFPKLEPIDGGAKINLSDQMIAYLIKKTSFACAAGPDSRPIFTGCLMDIEGNEFNMAATNTHRLAIAKREFEGDPIKERSQYIIPKKAIEEVYHVISPDVTNEIEISCTKSKAGFKIGDIYITTRVIEGNFPNYENAIPKGNKIKATMDTQSFIAAVNRVSLIARASNYNTMKMEFFPEKLRLSSDNPEVGRVDEEIPITSEGIENAPLSIAFNSDYVTDALKTFDSEKFTIWLRAPLVPVIIKEEGNDSFTYVLTPVRTSDNV